MLCPIVIGTLHPVIDALLLCHKSLLCTGMHHAWLNETRGRLQNLLDLAHAPFTHTSTFAKGWPIPEVVRFRAEQVTPTLTLAVL